MKWLTNERCLLSRGQYTLLGDRTSRLTLNGRWRNCFRRAFVQPEVIHLLTIDRGAELRCIGQDTQRTVLHLGEPPAVHERM